MTEKEEYFRCDNCMQVVKGYHAAQHNQCCAAPYYVEITGPGNLEDVEPVPHAASGRLILHLDYTFPDGVDESREKVRLAEPLAEQLGEQLTAYEIDLLVIAATLAQADHRIEEIEGRR